MAEYHLGNLLYDKKRYEEAAEHWERAAREKPELAMARRNLAIYFYNKEKAPEKAMEAMEEACALDPAYPRFWLERDQLAARLGRRLKNGCAPWKSTGSFWKSTTFSICGISPC